MFIYFLYDLDFFKTIKSSPTTSLKVLKDLFTFNSNDPHVDKNLWVWNGELLLKTLEIVVSSTVISFFVALFTSYFSVPNLFNHRILVYINRIFLLFLRSFPILIFLTMFLDVIASKMFAAFCVYFWFTWLWLHKYLMEIIENTNLRKYYLARKLGKNQLIAFYQYVLLTNKNKYIMNLLLAIESNVRWSAILGAAGVFGIGILFKEYETQYQFLSISIFYIVLLIFSLEIILFLITKYLFNPISIQDNSLNTPTSFKYNYKKYIKIALVIFLIAFCLYSLIEILTENNGQLISWTAFNTFFNNFFKLDFSDVREHPQIYLVYWELFEQVYVALFLGILGAIFYSFWCASRLHNYYQTLLFKLFLSYLKAIPIIVFFAIFNPTFATKTALTLALAVGTFRGLTKQFTEHFNAINGKQIKLLQNKGWNILKIYLNYMLPKALKQLQANSIFEFENTYRNAMNYSLFITSGIYSRINNIYLKNDEQGKIIPYFLPAIILFILIELVHLGIKEQWIDKIKLNFIKLKKQRKNLTIQAKK
ncbi:hypothetical protein [Mycoplasma hafezii]|uniref:hypothetical protein n=1 Tax=Mycoplasma hafezii TaxID=525886 RepID=UPI003CF2E80D